MLKERKGGRKKGKKGRRDREKGAAVGMDYLRQREKKKMSHVFPPTPITGMA